MRFFFDYTTRGRSLYDYSGDEFRTLQSAIEFAEAIAEDLRHRLANDWAGWQVEVRNSEGIRYLSLPVDVAGAIGV